MITLFLKEFYDVFSHASFLTVLQGSLPLDSAINRPTHSLCTKGMWCKGIAKY